MNKNFWLKIGLSIVLLAVLIAAGGWVFHLGLVQGAAANGELPTVGGRTDLPYAGMMGAYRQGMSPYGLGMHSFFSPFRFLGGLLVFFLILGLVRVLFFGGWADRRYHHAFYPHGMGRPSGDDSIPPMVEEWHRKMHEKENSGEN